MQMSSIGLFGVAYQISLSNRFKQLLLLDAAASWQIFSANAWVISSRKLEKITSRLKGMLMELLEPQELAMQFKSSFFSWKSINGEHSRKRISIHTPIFHHPDSDDHQCISFGTGIPIILSTSGATSLRPVRVLSCSEEVIIGEWTKVCTLFVVWLGQIFSVPG